MNTMQFNNLVGRTTLGIEHSWIEWHGNNAANTAGGEGTIMFRIGVRGPDNYVSDTKATYQVWYGRWWILTPDMNEQQVRNTLFLAALTYVEHEARERFLIDGKSPYENSH